MNAPWAPPGAYTVRLTVDGKSYTQPLTLKLDPRVKTPAVALKQLSTLTREMYDGAVATHAASLQARALAAELEQVSSPNAGMLKAQVDSLAPAAPRGGGGGRGGRGGAASTGAPTLQDVSAEMLAAAMAMQSADLAPTASQIAAVARARAEGAAILARWATVQANARSLSVGR